jgi:hypothetical protein
MVSYLQEENIQQIQHPLHPPFLRFSFFDLILFPFPELSSAWIWSTSFCFPFLFFCILLQLRFLRCVCQNSGATDPTFLALRLTNGFLVLFNSWKRTDRREGKT